MSWVLYGASGYTGALIAEEAVRRGHAPLLAGRSADKLEPLARRLGLSFKAVGLDDAAGLATLLEGRGAVLHAAGPFVRTSKAMADACLATGTHYLDITGELPVFGALYARDAEARARRISLIPGVGFDVLPTDCLAVWLARRVPSPRRLLLAIDAIGRPSSGTAKSAVGMLPGGGQVRRAGRLEPWPLGRGLTQVPFAHRDAWALPVPLGDLESAYRSTGVPDITTCLCPPRSVVQVLRAGWLVAAVTTMIRPVLRVEAVQRRLEAWVGARAEGPDAEQRKRGRSFIYGRVEGAAGEVAEGWLDTADGYELTAVACVRSIERVLAERPVGALAPATAFGADFVLELGATRRDHR